MQICCPSHISYFQRFEYKELNIKIYCTHFSCCKTKKLVCATCSYVRYEYTRAFLSFYFIFPLVGCIQEQQKPTSCTSSRSRKKKRRKKVCRVQQVENTGLLATLVQLYVQIMKKKRKGVRKARKRPLSRGLPPPASPSLVQSAFAIHAGISLLF